VGVDPSAPKADVVEDQPLVLTDPTPPPPVSATLRDLVMVRDMAKQTVDQTQARLTDAQGRLVAAQQQVDAAKKVLGV